MLDRIRVIRVDLWLLLSFRNLKLTKMLPRLLRQFAAVMVGSLLYFFVLMSHLPPAARHEPYRLDLGFLVNAWVCLVLYGLVELILRRKK